MPLSRCRKVPIVRSAPRAIRWVKPALMSRIRPEKSASPSGKVHWQCLWSGNTTQASIWNGRRASSVRAASRNAAISTTNRSERRCPQIYREEVGTPWHASAAIVGHRRHKSLHSQCHPIAGLRCAGVGVLEHALRLLVSMQWSWLPHQFEWPLLSMRCGPGHVLDGRKPWRISPGIGRGRVIRLRALTPKEKTSALEAACRWAWADVIQLQRKVHVTRVDKWGLPLRLRNDGVREPDGVGN